MQRLSYSRYSLMLLALIGAGWVSDVGAQQPPLPVPSAGVPEVSLPKAVDPNPATGATPSAPGQLPVALPNENKAAQAAAAVADPRKPAEGRKIFSFGSSGISVLFLPVEISRMKTAIIDYESVHSDTTQQFEELKPVHPVNEVINVVEPPKYPVFFLTSIVYRSPADWAIWIGGHKITSQKNESDVKVLAVSNETATLAWKPDYSDALKQRKKQKAFVSTEALKNKLSVVQRLGLDQETGLVTFTLRPNQSFSVGHFSVFEGYVDNPQMPPLGNYTSNESFGIENGASRPPSPAGIPGGPSPQPLSPEGVPAPVPPSPGPVYQNQGGIDDRPPMPPQPPGVQPPEPITAPPRL